jgi:2-haloacid dehalogenase
MNRVRRGDLPWTSIDRLHRMILDDLLKKYDITGLTEAERDNLNRVWHRLTPWPDAIQGLERLRKRFIVAALSNGNIALLTNMAKHSGLSWDCILSSELARHYKPDPEVYQTAADLLGLPPEQVMMVAAHKRDLNGAKAAGLRTAFVARPLEFGPDVDVDCGPDPAYNVFTEDFKAGDLTTSSLP